MSKRKGGATEFLYIGFWMFVGSLIIWGLMDMIDDFLLSPLSWLLVTAFWVPVFSFICRHFFTPSSSPSKELLRGVSALLWLSFLVIPTSMILRLLWEKYFSVTGDGFYRLVATFALGLVASFVFAILAWLVAQFSGQKGVRVSLVGGVYVSIVFLVLGKFFLFR
jgi:hypothetical protein